VLCLGKSQNDPWASLNLLLIKGTLRNPDKLESIVLGMGTSQQLDKFSTSLNKTFMLKKHQRKFHKSQKESLNCIKRKKNCKIANEYFKRRRTHADNAHYENIKEASCMNILLHKITIFSLI
jgi:hypothetical protein